MGKKREIGRRYISLLEKSKKIKIQNFKFKYAKNIFWVFGVLLKKNIGIKRDYIVNKLVNYNIQTRNFFTPMHKQTIFKKMNLFSKTKNLKNSEYLSLNGFYLPSGIGISNKDIDYVGKTLIKILESKN